MSVQSNQTPVTGLCKTCADHVTLKVAVYFLYNIINNHIHSEVLRFQSEVLVKSSLNADVLATML